MLKLDVQSFAFEGFNVFYADQLSTSQTVDEVLVQEVYKYPQLINAKKIIDLGANIGISCLFFKKYAPKAQIICIEPDPVSYEILLQNIEENNLENIETIPAAVSSETGFAPFYGQVSDQNYDARGNSLIAGWGIQRRSSQSITVPTIQLSSLLDETVSFLKLDIEGAEELVLTEAQHKLHLVENIFIEYHQCKSILHLNSLDRISKLLEKIGFDIEVSAAESGVFPKPVLDWAKRESSSLFFIRGKNRSVYN